MEEIWKDVSGYEGLYKVSNLGRIKSLKWRGGRDECILTPKLNNKGYLWVILYKNKNKKCFLIHRLVAIAFIPMIDGLYYVNHKDENKTNNNVENLEWCTLNYNVRYSMNLHPDRYKNRNTRKKFSQVKGVPYKHKSEVVQYDLNGNEISFWDSIAQVCAINNWRTSSILECCVGKRKTAYGFVWKFSNGYKALTEKSV